MLSAAPSSSPLHPVPFPLPKFLASSASVPAGILRLTVPTPCGPSSMCASTNGSSTLLLPVLQRFVRASTASLSALAKCTDREEVGEIQDMIPASDPNDWPCVCLRFGLGQEGPASLESLTLPMLSNGGK